MLLALVDCLAFGQRATPGSKWFDGLTNGYQYSKHQALPLLLDGEQSSDSSHNSCCPAWWQPMDPQKGRSWFVFTPWKLALTFLRRGDSGKTSLLLCRHQCITMIYHDYNMSMIGSICLPLLHMLPHLTSLRLNMHLQYQAMARTPGWISTHRVVWQHINLRALMVPGVKTITSRYIKRM